MVRVRCPWCNKRFASVSARRVHRCSPNVENPVRPPEPSSDELSAATVGAFSALVASVLESSTTKPDDKVDDGGGTFGGAGASGSWDTPDTDSPSTPDSPTTTD